MNNNDPADSTSVPAPTPPVLDTSSSSTGDGDPVAVPITSAAPAAAQARATLQMKKKYEFINGIMENLDMLIYVELCSFFRLLMRVLAQVMFLTPKPSFVPPMPKHRPYIGAIFGPNVICILLHVFTSRAEAGEAMRGYLHGGIIIDLIGQKGPTSTFHLVMLDLLVLAMQCFMLAVHVERERLKDALVPKPGTGGVQAGAEAVPVVVSAQDQDAEERGVLRETVVAGDGTGSGDIEMQPLASTSREGEEELQRQRLLSDPALLQEHNEDDDYPLDVFYSGTAVVGDFHVLHTLRTQWDEYGQATASALQTVGFSAEVAVASADRRIGAVRRNLEASFTP
ncbi:DUF1746-domain-containing protein [Phlyctema vagabunda]|uniref:DUF1746-domain-containing protein n=1 Tax=Phlyctema vagabunda TaxID=108571 RepID=A0ABR4PJN3_9HELO